MILLDGWVSALPVGLGTPWWKSELRLRDIASALLVLAFLARALPAQAMAFLSGL
jgi:hypothetical protein